MTNGHILHISVHFGYVEAWKWRILASRAPFLSHCIFKEEQRTKCCEVPCTSLRGHLHPCTDRTLPTSCLRIWQHLCERCQNIIFTTSGVAQRTGTRRRTATMSIIALPGSIPIRIKPKRRKKKIWAPPIRRYGMNWAFKHRLPFGAAGNIVEKIISGNNLWGTPSATIIVVSADPDNTLDGGQAKVSHLNLDSSQPLDTWLPLDSWRSLHRQLIPSV